MNFLCSHCNCPTWFFAGLPQARFCDGGAQDNLAIAALLRRGVKFIVAGVASNCIPNTTIADFARCKGEGEEWVGGKGRKWEGWIVGVMEWWMDGFDLLPEKGKYSQGSPCF
jgi:hypothetical protein